MSGVTLLSPSLATAAQYFPLAHGRYRVTPDLFAFGKDFGNGPVDRQVFQIDRHFATYRANALQVRAEEHDKYVCDALLPDPLGRRVSRFVTERLLAEHPRFFHAATRPHGLELCCKLTGESLAFATDFSYQRADSRHTVEPTYSSGLDALAAQVQEDLAVLCLGDEGDQVCAIHLSAPNYWAPRDKVGRPFDVVHAAVPGMEALNRNPRPLIDAIVRRGPYVRFAWGLTMDDRLNHHPQPPPDVDAAAWAGRRFDAAAPRLFLRIERQTLHGFPELNAALFTIRTYFRDVSQLRGDRTMTSALISAIETMTPAQLAYKGLAPDRGAMLGWLRQGWAVRR